MERPVFIPLKRRFFEAFAAGEKRTEFRLLGARWNERVCAPGRAVTLSCGYSGARLSGRIDGFAVRTVADVPVMREVYPGARDSDPVACIEISLTAP